MDFIKSDDAEYRAPAKALPFRVFSVFRGYPVMDRSTGQFPLFVTQFLRLAIQFPLFVSRFFAFMTGLLKVA